MVTRFLLFFIFPFSQFFSQTFPSHTITVCEPGSGGYYFSSLLKVDKAFPSFKQCHFIMDGKGDIVYKKSFPIAQLTCDFKLQPNGLISYYYNSNYYLMDSTFTIVDSASCKNGIEKDAHELVVLKNGNYLLLGNETVSRDLSGFKMFTKKQAPGSKNAQVRCGVIQEQDKNKNVVFEWHAKDFYDFSDTDPFFLTDTLNVDWTHFNSIECDQDNNYIVSVRYLNELTKIDRNTGKIIWRMGGKKNEFKFINDPGMFLGQHDARVLANGHLTLFDNGRMDSLGHPAIAKEYILNEQELTATLTWSYQDKADANSIYSGSVQRLRNGNTLVDYGSSDKSRTLFNVVNPGGAKLFEIVFTDTLGSYRSFNYESLPWTIKRPNITLKETENGLYLDAGAGYKSYRWSNGAQTRTIKVSKPGEYKVWVPVGKSGGRVSSPSYKVSALRNQKK